MGTDTNDNDIQINGSEKDSVKFPEAGENEELLLQDKNIAEGSQRLDITNEHALSTLCVDNSEDDTVIIPDNNTLQCSEEKGNESSLEMINKEKGAQTNQPTHLLEEEDETIIPETDENDISLNLNASMNFDNRIPNVEDNAYDENTVTSLPPSNSEEESSILPDLNNAPITSLQKVPKERVTCDVCHKSFSQKSYYVKHKKKFHSESLIKCHVCFTVFVDENKFEKHYKKQHFVKSDKALDNKVPGEKQLFKCNFCDRTFQLKRSLNNHMLVHTGETRFKCDICGANFITSSSLENHQKKMHTDVITTIQCSMCDEVFFDQESLALHKSTHADEKPFECNWCQKLIFGAQHVIKHIKKHVEKKPRECNICHKVFSGTGNLNNHKRVHSGEKPYKCEICQRSFSEKGSLRKHRLIHTGEKPHVCDVCNKTFSQRGHLIMHMSVIHSGDVSYTCDICNRPFAYKNSLRRHKFTHTGEKTYECEVCHKMFPHQGRLTSHLETHRRSEIFKCDKCPKTFYRRTNLLAHTKLHGDKRFHCNVCQRGFHRRGTYVVHMRIHSGEKPFECDQCDKTFARKERLDRHVKSHLAPEPPFFSQCKICFKTFTRKSSATRHMQSHFQEMGNDHLNITSDIDFTNYLMLSKPNMEGIPWDNNRNNMEEILPDFSESVTSDLSESISDNVSETIVAPV